MTQEQTTADRHVIIYRTASDGADETVFFGTIAEARAHCDWLVSNGNAISAYLEQDQ